MEAPDGGFGVDGGLRLRVASVVHSLRLRRRRQDADDDVPFDGFEDPREPGVAADSLKVFRDDGFRQQRPQRRLGRDDLTPPLAVLLRQNLDPHSGK